MSLSNYRVALSNAAQIYENKKGKRLSARRKKDILDLQKIIQDALITNPFDLKVAVIARLKKIRTGWWIFQTGDSELKEQISMVINAPEYKPEIIMQNEILIAQKKLNEVQSETEKLKSESAKLSLTVFEQNCRIYENKCQISLQEQKLEGKRFYFSYEEYIINMLDKLINKQPLHVNEAEQLLHLLDENGLKGFSLQFRRILMQKMTDACEASFYNLVEGIDHLIDQNTLQIQTFKCALGYANYYCKTLKEQIKDTPYFEHLMTKLLSSYYQDGAGKTKVSSLSTYSKVMVLGSKEMLITHYGNERQRVSIEPLCELRRESRWHEFKDMCLQKAQFLSDWLRRKKQNMVGRKLLKDASSENEVKNDSNEKIESSNPKCTL